MNMKDYSITQNSKLSQINDMRSWLPELINSKSIINQSMTERQPTVDSKIYNGSITDRSPITYSPKFKKKNVDEFRPYKTEFLSNKLDLTFSKKDSKESRIKSFNASAKKSEPSSIVKAVQKDFTKYLYKQIDQRKELYKNKGVKYRDGKKEVILHYTKIIQGMRNHFLTKSKRLRETTNNKKELGRLHLTQSKLRGKFLEKSRFCTTSSIKPPKTFKNVEIVSKNSTVSNNCTGKSWVTQLRDKRVLRNLSITEKATKFHDKKSIQNNNDPNLLDKSFVNTFSRIMRNVKSCEAQKKNFEIDFENIEYTNGKYVNKFKQTIPNKVKTLMGKDFNHKKGLSLTINRFHKPNLIFVNHNDIKIQDDN